MGGGWGRVKNITANLLHPLLNPPPSRGRRVDFWAVRNRVFYKPILEVELEIMGYSLYHNMYEEQI